MPYKQAPKSAALKALIGKQKNLPEALKQKILESPAKQTGEYTGDQFSKRVEKKKREKHSGKKVPSKGNTLKKGSEADKETLKRLSSDKYKSPAKQTSDPKKNAELKRLKEIAKAREARSVKDKKTPKPKKQTKAEALVGKLKQLGNGEATGVGTGRKG
jgi:hypothetical protein